MNYWFALAQGALGGGAIGALVSPYLTQRQERRQARANAREKIAEAENARRVPNDDLSGIVIQLRTAAMIAGVPRIVAEKYISTATEYHKHILTAPDGELPKIDKDSPEKWIGFLNIRAVMAADVLSKVLWHPWLGRLFVSFRLRLKLWRWHRHLTLLTVQSAVLHYSRTENIPADDESVILLSYCYDHLPWYAPNGMTPRQRIKTYLRKRSQKANNGLALPDTSSSPSGTVG